MSFCSKCGNNIADGVSFCSKCGAKITPFEQAQKVAEENVTTYAESVSQPVYRPVSYPPTIMAIKKLGSAPLFLIAVIAFTINVLWSFIMSVSGKTGITSALYMAANSLMSIDSDAAYYIMDMIDEGYAVMRGVDVLFAIISIIPVALTAVGLWMIFASCADKSGKKLGTGGLSVIKIISIINLVFVCIGAFLIEIVFLIAMIASANSFAGGDVAWVFGLSMLLVLLVYIPVIIYYVKVIKSINVAKHSILTARPCEKASRFVGVLCYAGAGVTVIGFIVSVIQAIVTFGYMGGVFSNFVTTICSTTAYICFGMLIFRYRAYMMNIINMARQRAYEENAGV